MINKSHNNKRFFRKEMNVGCYFGFSIVVITIFLFLLGIDHTVFSLGAIFIWISHLSSTKQLIAIGLMPIYLSFIIFGGGIIGAIIGKKIQALLFYFVKEIDE